MRTVRARNPVQVVFRGETITVFRVGQLAESIGRSQQTVWSWHRKGILPAMVPPFVGAREERYYSAAMIQAVVDAIEGNERHDGGGGLLDVDKFKRKVTKAWKELGVVPEE